MSPRSTFAVTARLGFVAAYLMFALMVIGSIVRTTGSGLACPDWPLCHGRLIPPFESHVLIEWFHRLVALLVGLMLFATSIWVWTHREPRAKVGGLAGLAVALYFTQALLGALTVWRLLSPAMVSSHLAVAMLLLLTLLTLTWNARAAIDPAPPRVSGVAVVRPWLALAMAWTWGQAVLGGVVSSSHACCVCPDWPTCNGRWFPAMSGLVGLQMTHRLSAYLLFVLIAFTALRARGAGDPRVAVGAAIALGLTVLQIGLGVANVMLQAPPWLSAAHLATATAIFAVLARTHYRAALVSGAAARVALAEAT